MEHTLALIKPDGVKKRVIGQIIARYEKAGLQVVAMKLLTISKKEAEGFYAVHKERPFFNALTGFMSSGPIVALVLRGENAIAVNREVMGATNPKDAKEGTIRKDFATSIDENTVHGSDAPETAKEEIKYFFSNLEHVL